MSFIKRTWARLYPGRGRRRRRARSLAGLVVKGWRFVPKDKRDVVLTGKEAPKKSVGRPKGSGKKQKTAAAAAPAASTGDGSFRDVAGAVSSPMIDQDGGRKKATFAPMSPILLRNSSMSEGEREEWRRKGRIFAKELAETEHDVHQ